MKKTLTPRQAKKLLSTLPKNWQRTIRGYTKFVAPSCDTRYWLADFLSEKLYMCVSAGCRSFVRRPEYVRTGMCDVCRHILEEEGEQDCGNGVKITTRAA